MFENTKKHEFYLTLAQFSCIYTVGKGGDNFMLSSTTAVLFNTLSASSYFNFESSNFICSLMRHLIKAETLFIR